MVPKSEQEFSELLFRFAQFRCPISLGEPAGGSKVRSEFYKLCYLYRDRFDKEPSEDMLVVLWMQVQND